MSALQSIARIKKEYREVTGAKDAGVGAELVNDDFGHWKGTIGGPKGTPYEGGLFVVDIVIPPNYPFVPPKMKFDTKVWHPNVSSANGAICLDILKNEWSPALTLRTALLSLQALLSCPNPDSPQDAEVATQYKADKKKFDQTAKYWTDTYATPKKKEELKEAANAKINKLAEMGFDKKKCAEALEKTKGDESAAVEWLFSH